MIPTVIKTGKADIQAMALNIAKIVRDGDEDALSVFIKCKAVKKACEDAERIIESEALNQADFYGSKTFNVGGAEVQVKECGVKYNFSELGHRKYDDICSEINRLTDEKKRLETILKAHNSVWVETDIETGETYEVNPCVKSSKTTLAVTFK